jgi:hypothetical protein
LNAPSVVEQAVLNELDLRTGVQIKMLANIVGYLHHAALLIGSNIVGFANNALVYDHIESISHITNIPVNIEEALDANNKAATIRSTYKKLRSEAPVP